MTAMEQNIDRVTANITAHINAVLFTNTGNWIALLSFLSAFFANSIQLFVVLFMLIIVDLVFGLAVSLKKKGKGSLESCRMKDTGLKLAFNMVLLFISFLIEKTVNNQIDTSEIGTTIVFAILASSEVISILANMSIIAPNMVVLRFFHLLFRNEIARKLGIENDEVDKILRENKRHRKQRAVDTENEIEETENLKKV